MSAVESQYGNDLQEAIRRSLLEVIPQQEEVKPPKVNKKVTSLADSIRTYENDLQEAIERSRVAVRSTSPLSNQVKDKPGVLAFVLPQLTDAQREAGVCCTVYSAWFTSVSHDYHKSGDRWSCQKLQRLFTQGMLRYYIQEALGIRYRIDYEKERFVAISTLATIRRTLGIEQGVKMNVEYIYMAKEMIKRYCEATPVLLHLGIQYQRKKVELEKLQEKQECFQAILALDKEVETLQQKIYYLIQDGVQQIKTFIKDKPLTEIQPSDFRPLLPLEITVPKEELSIFPVELEEITGFLR